MPCVSSDVNLCPIDILEYLSGKKPQQINFGVQYPIYTPPKIRWNWNDNTGWNEIVGDEYQMTEVPQKISVSWSVDLVDSRGQIYDSLSGTITVDAPVGSIYYTQTASNVYVLYLSYGDGKVAELDRIINLSGSGQPRPFTVPPYANPRITDISPVGDKSYNLKIYYQGDLVYDETRATNPTVEKIPEKCEYEETIIPIGTREGTVTGLTSVQILQGEDSNGKYAYIKIVALNPIDNNPDALIWYRSLSIDKKCDLPVLICYECVACENCPSGTVTRIFDTSSNTILCVDSDACVISSIPYDANCESYDCVC